MSQQANDSPPTATEEFAVKDCVLIAIATGHRAFSLMELRDRLRTVQVDSIYNHFWGAHLQPRFTEREYNNDFAAWVRHRIHDAKLAEELAVVDPWRFADLEGLRQELLDLVDERLDEAEYLHWARATEPFDFERSQIVVFDTYRRLTRPEELPEAIPHLATGSIFYHFIDARRRSREGLDDFSQWLSSFGDAYRPVCEQLAVLEPYFGPLSELRSQLTAIFAAEPSGGEGR